MMMRTHPAELRVGSWQALRPLTIPPLVAGGETENPLPHRRRHGHHAEPPDTQQIPPRERLVRLDHVEPDRLGPPQLLPPTPPDDPTAKPRYGTCMGIVALDNQRRVMVSFVAMTDNPEERFAYMSMAEQILASILPIEAVMPPQAPQPAR